MVNLEQKFELEMNEVPQPPPIGNPKINLAAVVLGIAVVLLAVFIVAGILTTPKPRVEKSPNRSSLVPGSSLYAFPANKTLRPIEHPGEPPNNILNAITLPVGIRSLKTNLINDSETGQFYGQMEFSVPATQTDVINFYRTEMRVNKWSIFSSQVTQHPTNGFQLLAKKAGTDGWYWEMGATVYPTNFKSTGTSLPQATKATSSRAISASTKAADSTDFTITLFQMPDAD